MNGFAALDTRDALCYNAIKKAVELRIMRKYATKIKQITIACAITMMIYVLTAWITSAFMHEAAKSLYWLALWIYSLALMGVFNLILIYRTYGKNAVGEEVARQDFQNGYWGVKNDTIRLIQREFSTFIAFALINGTSWIMISIDKLIFSKRTISAIFLLYAPLNIVSVTLPSWANRIRKEHTT